MNWNEKSEPVKRDHFFIGFIPGFVLPGIFNLLIFKMKWTTDQNIFYAMWKMAQKGFLTKDLMAALLPTLLLIFIFSVLKKERSTAGAFVGLCPWLMLSLWFV